MRDPRGVKGKSDGTVNALVKSPVKEETEATSNPLCNQRPL